MAKVGAWWCKACTRPERHAWPVHGKALRRSCPKGGNLEARGAGEDVAKGSAKVARLKHCSVTCTQEAEALAAA